jgi:hypothetical protein
VLSLRANGWGLWPKCPACRIKPSSARAKPTDYVTDITHVHSYRRERRSRSKIQPAHSDCSPEWMALGSRASGFTTCRVRCQWHDRSAAEQPAKSEDTGTVACAQRNATPTRTNRIQATQLGLGWQWCRQDGKHTVPPHIMMQGGFQLECFAKLFERIRKNGWACLRQHGLSAPALTQPGSVPKHPISTYNHEN